MKKNILVLFMLICLIIFLIKKYHSLKLFDFINKRTFVMSLETFTPKNSKIVIFKGVKKESEIPVNNLSSMLLIEKDRLFYFENFYLEEKNIIENFIVIFDLKTKKIIKKIKIPFNKSIFNIKKVKNKIYFTDISSDEIRFNNKKNNLYCFDLENNKIEMILDYDTEGLPLILESEIIYSKENKIYLFKLENKTNMYLFDGVYPFEIEKNFLYYEENGKIIKRNINGNNKKIIYTKKYKNRRAIKKLNNSVYVFIILEDQTKLPFDVNFLEVVDIKSNAKINLNKVFSNSNKNTVNISDFYGLNDNNFIIS